jgi:hypothetical protein
MLIRKVALYCSRDRIHDKDKDDDKVLKDKGCATDNRSGYCHNSNHANNTEWWNIGGPNTVLPNIVESFLCWSLALSCLSISGYHYIKDNYCTMTLRTATTILYEKVIQRFLLYPLLRLYFGQKMQNPMVERYHDKSDASPLPVSQQHEQEKPQQLRQHKFPCWLPLMTYSRAELQRGTPYERYIQLGQLLDCIDPSYLIRRDMEIDNYADDKVGDQVLHCTLSDKELVQLIRNNEIIRRLVSLALRPSSSSSSSITNEKDVRQQPFGQQLIRIWPQLLVLPSIQLLKTDDDNHRNHTVLNSSHSIEMESKPIMIIALIIPCYHETTKDIIDKLKYALHHCHSPQQVQVRLVMAGKNAQSDQNNLQSTLHRELNTMNQVPYNNATTNHHQWGDVQIIEFLEESGRGPCLNYGSTYDSRTDPHRNNNKIINKDDNILIYTFCHSDTRLPYHWDRTLIQTLYPPSPPIDEFTFGNSSTKSLQSQQKRINACAYRFGIDTSGLQKKSTIHQRHNSNGDNRYYYPPGIHAIEVTANLRCTFWSLPYGDQCISLRKDDFHYLGGFPHQCLMEDYELVTLLRKRMKLLPMFRNAGNEIRIEEEVLQILPGPPVRCSPRRWQKFGVFYVTYTNSRLVQLYNKNNNSRMNDPSHSSVTQPEEIYQLYYGQTLDVWAPKSPWEIELERMLEQHR